MNKEILLVAETVSNEKGVPKEVIFDAIETALEVATQKKSTKDISVEVNINTETGDYETFRCWEIIADEQEMENSEAQIYLKAAVVDHPEVEVGSVIQEPIDSVEFGRISAQIAKHIIIQKVREAEREQTANEYVERLGDLISGVVKRVMREGIIIDLGNGAEGFIARENMLPRETARMGDRMRAYLLDVDREAKGPQIMLSRTDVGMLIKLFTIEVPEIGEEIIEIKGAARDPGSRAKIAVKTNDGRIDPVGACVGMRGSRVQTVSGELGGERIDIVLWNDNPVQLVINAMAPAEVLSIDVDEDTHSMDLAVAEAELSQAIGRGGQNVNLASQLSGWTLNVMSEDQMEEKSDAEAMDLVKKLMNALAIEEETAISLVEEGFGTVEEVAYVPVEELLAIEGFEEDMVKALRDRAKDIALTKAIAEEEEYAKKQPAEDLLTMEGMDESLAQTLAGMSIITMEDLAEQSTDELMVIEGMTTERAGELIMTARKPWFEEE